MLAVVACGLLLAPSAQAARPSSGVTASLPIIGTPCTITTATGTVPGTVSAATFTVTSFGTQGGQLVANGFATVTCAAGSLTQTATQTFTNVSVTGGTGSCRILHLELGPLDRPARFAGPSRQGGP
jgi:hypothetical protein